MSSVVLASSTTLYIQVLTSRISRLRTTGTRPTIRSNTSTIARLGQVPAAAVVPTRSALHETPVVRLHLRPGTCASNRARPRPSSSAGWSASRLAKATPFAVAAQPASRLAEPRSSYAARDATAGSAAIVVAAIVVEAASPNYFYFPKSLNLYLPLWGQSQVGLSLLTPCFAQGSQSVFFARSRDQKQRC